MSNFSDEPFKLKEIWKLDPDNILQKLQTIYPLVFGVKGGMWWGGMWNEELNYFLNDMVILKSSSCKNSN